MRILLVHNSYRQPGGEDIVFDQERALLKEAGHEVFTYHRSNRELDGHNRLHQLADCLCSVWAPDARRDFIRLLSLHNIDIVHVHNTFMMISPSIYSACREARVPVVQTIHNFRLLCPSGSFLHQGAVCELCASRSLLYAIPHRCYRESYFATGAIVVALLLHRRLHTWTRNVDRFILLSEFARKKFIQAGFPEGRLTVKPNFVYPDPGERTRPGCYAIYAGRLSEEKGLFTLVKAWGLLQSPLPLLVVGDGPLRPQLQQLCRGSRVEFVRYKARQDCIALIKNACFLVMPSECFENFPIAIIEAYACGVPVIASRIGSLPEIVKDSTTGLTFRASDAEGLRQVVHWAISNPDLMHRMGRCARREFEDRYTAARNLSLLMQVYRQTISDTHCQSTLRMQPYETAPRDSISA